MNLSENPACHPGRIYFAVIATIGKNRELAILQKESCQTAAKVFRSRLSLFVLPAFAKIRVIRGENAAFC
ncbi:MAG: hypothetical protein H6695_15210 [Deferribacteres bacterium]|nr:hypothetical protein [candidate division KSB1 bacterium]MCB9511536.1 hypothetical protein [Deferribacteres bacterium]